MKEIEVTSAQKWPNRAFCESLAVTGRNDVKQMTSSLGFDAKAFTSFTNDAKLFTSKR